jgi:5-oxoprolinase (ATP-hydrolysing)
MTAAILANNRKNRPHGMAGGEPVHTGRNWVERIDGTREEFGHILQGRDERDDVFSSRRRAAAGSAKPGEFGVPAQARDPAIRRPTHGIAAVRLE